MTEYKQLSPKLSVRPQVEPDEVGELAARGIKGIVNARPGKHAANVLACAL